MRNERLEKYRVNKVLPFSFKPGHPGNLTKLAGDQ